MSWIPIGKGRLDVRGRPGRKYWNEAVHANVTRVVTLLSENEGAAEIGQQTIGAGLQWTWLPLEGANPKNIKDPAALRAQLSDLAALLLSGESVVVHCAAGIHRTGMIAYALLRLSGSSPEGARRQLKEMRSETAEGVGEERLAWVDALVKPKSSAE